MTRGKAIQWLYWYHAREAWDRFHDSRGWLVHMAFPKPPPN